MWLVLRAGSARGCDHRVGHVDFAVGDPPRNGPALSFSPPTPNPARDESTLRFRLPGDGHVRVTIVDVTGRVVSRAVDEERTAGDNTVVVDTSELVPGLYFAQLAWAGRTANQRLAIVR